MGSPDRSLDRDTLPRALCCRVLISLNSDTNLWLNHCLRHACGEASDLVQVKCVAAGASYVIVPCCVGKTKASSSVTYPRSEAAKAAITGAEYKHLARAADFGHGGYDASASRHGDSVVQSRRLCKGVVEMDRNQWAAEHGYEVTMALLHPESCTPKNDLLVGVKKTEEAKEVGEGAGE